MPLLRAVVLPGLGAIAVLAAAGRAMRLLGGDDPREDRAVRALQDAFGHRPDDGDAAVATDPPTYWATRVDRPGHRAALVVLRRAADHRERGDLVRRHLGVDARPALSGRPCRGARPRDCVLRRIRGAGGTATTRRGVAAGAAACDVVVPLRAHGGSLRAPRNACRPARSPRRPRRAAPGRPPSVRDSRSDRVFAGVPRPAPHLGHCRGRHAGTVERRCGAAGADNLRRGRGGPRRQTVARVSQSAHSHIADRPACAPWRLVSVGPSNTRVSDRAQGATPSISRPGKRLNHARASTGALWHSSTRSNC